MFNVSTSKSKANNNIVYDGVDYPPPRSISNLTNVWIILPYAHVNKQTENKQLSSDTK